MHYLDSVDQFGF